MISFSWTFFSLLKKWIWKKTSHNRASPPQTARHSIRKGKHLTTGYHDTNRRLTLYDVICYILWWYMFITYINIYIYTYILILYAPLFVSLLIYRVPKIVRWQKPEVWSPPTVPGGSSSRSAGVCTWGQVSTPWAVVKSRSKDVELLNSSKNSMID